MQFENNIHRMSASNFADEVFPDDALQAKIKDENTQIISTLSANQKASEIIKILFENRRLLAHQQESEGNFSEEAEPHFTGIVETIKRFEPLTLILPGFPAKSPNRKKTLGPLPDLAEKHALDNLFNLCQKIERVYSPGAKITICSDGRVFSDLVRIADSDVSSYGRQLKSFANTYYPHHFDFFNLDDVYPDIRDFEVMREELLIHFGESIETLRKRCKTEKHAEAMYKGITRFIFEDYSGLEEFGDLSRNSIQNKARIIAYRVIQRSNAWTRLLEHHFPHAVRLSIHPQFRVSKKIGVFLVDTEDSWQTPWHAVAVKENGNIRLMKRSDAEKRALLAFENGLPSHFEVISSPTTTDSAG